MKSRKYLFEIMLLIFITYVISACNQNTNSKYKDVLKVVTNGNVSAFLTYLNKDGVLGKVKEYYVVIVNDSVGPFEEVDISSLKFTDDGKFLIWTAIINGNHFVFKNNEQFGPFDEINDLEVFPNSVLKIEAEIKGKDYLFIGNKTFGPYDDYIYGQLRADGNYVYYAKEGDVYYVLESETNFKAGPFKYSPIIRKSDDNKTISYEADYYGKKIFGIGNKIIGLDYEEILWPNFIPNSNSIYYNAKIDGFWYIFVDTNKFGPFMDASYLNFSSDGKSFAYSGETNGAYYVYFKNKIFGPFDNVTSLRISPFGYKVAFVSVENGKCFVNVDNEKAGPFDLVQFIIFSETGERLLYLTNTTGKKVGNLVEITGHYIHYKEETFGPFRDIFYWSFLPYDKGIAFDITKQDGSVFRYDGKKEIGPFKEFFHPDNYPEDGTTLFAGKKDSSWQIYYGNKILGKYPDIQNFDYSETNKCIKMEAEYDNEWHSLVFLNSNAYVGSTWKDYRVFIKGSKIILEKSENVKHSN